MVHIMRILFMFAIVLLLSYLEMLSYASELSIVGKYRKQDQKVINTDDANVIHYGNVDNVFQCALR